VREEPEPKNGGQNPYKFGTELHDGRVAAVPAKTKQRVPPPT
jgi:hypothetical protein